MVKKKQGLKKKEQTKSNQQTKQKRTWGKLQDNFKGDQIADKVLLPLMLLVLTLVLLIGPFYRGLFFPHELLFANIVIFGLLAIWGLFRILKKDGRFIESPIELCMVVLVVAYLVAFLGFAAHKRDALEELLKIASYLVIYLVALDICRYWPWPISNDFLSDGDDEPENKPVGLPLLVHILYFVTIVITIASLGVAAGFWDFVGAYASNRIASPMGYANTAAAYLMAAYFFTVALALMAGGLKKIFYLAPAPLMLIAVILTFSRGAWLLLPCLGLIMILVSPPANRLRLFLYMLATALPALPTAFISDQLFRSSTPGLSVLPLLVSILAGLSLAYLAELFIASSLKLRRIIAGFTIFAIVIFLALMILVPLTRPLERSIAYDEPEGVQSFRQVITDIDSGQKYRLLFDLSAEIDLPPGAQEPDFAWGVTVIGNDFGRRDVILFDNQEKDTDGWQSFDFSIETGDGTTWFEVIFYNRYPGTSFSARDVQLISSGSEVNLNFELSRILPERLYSRITRQDRSVDLRLEFFRDSIKIIRDYPIFGIGGGGWAAIYRSYQEIPYNSREIHNQFLQVWVESGVFGFLAFIGLWVSFAFAFLRNVYKQGLSNKRWQLWVVLFIPVATLGTHSIIDWNFAMMAVGIFIFALFGAGRSLDRVIWWGKVKKGPGDHSTYSLLVGAIGIIFGIALFIYSLVLYNGLQTTWRSQELFERGNIKQAMAEMEKAIAMDPFRAENYHNLNVYLEEQALRTRNQAEMEKVIALSSRAHELEPYNVRYLYRYGDLMLNYVDINEGLKLIDKTIEVNPLSENTYLNAGYARIRLISFYMNEQAIDQARKYYQDLFLLEGKMQARYGNDLPLSPLIYEAAKMVGDIQTEKKYEIRIRALESESK